jgi:hypothetical protein
MELRNRIRGRLENPGGAITVTRVEDLKSRKRRSPDYKPLRKREMQNRSHAVMAQRREPLDSLDDFPTPPWAVRALPEHVIGKRHDLSAMTCLEPACNRGQMSMVLDEYFRTVRSSDVFNYGYGAVADFLVPDIRFRRSTFDWVITNPPFRLGEDFILKALTVARRGVAMLVRTTFLEGVGRHQRIFTPHPPTVIAQFVERVPMIQGRLDKTASTATSYCWLIWEKGALTNSKLIWIPPCRKALERDGDYPDPSP